jgi:dolichol-phosphate mannosyltransferase
LQDPPEVIPELVAKWKEGYELVFAVRRGREGETWFKKLSASLFYRLIFRITDVRIPLDTGALSTGRSLKSSTACAKHRFCGVGAWVFRQVGVPRSPGALRR